MATRLTPLPRFDTVVALQYLVNAPVHTRVDSVAATGCRPVAGARGGPVSATPGFGSGASAAISTSYPYDGRPARSSASCAGSAPEQSGRGRRVNQDPWRPTQ